MIFSLLTGCGFLDEDLFLDDDSYSESFEVGGLGLSGTGTSGHGYSYYSSTHYNFSASHYYSMWRGWKKQGVRLQIRQPDSDVNWTTAGTRTSVADDPESEGSDEEALDLVAADEIQSGVELYLALGYDVRIVSAGPTELVETLAPELVY